MACPAIPAAGRTMIEDYEAKGKQANGYLPYGLTLKHKHVPELQAYSRLSKRAIVYARGR